MSEHVTAAAGAVLDPWGVEPVLDLTCELTGYLRYVLDSQTDPELTPVDLDAALRSVAERLVECPPGVAFAGLLVELGRVAGDDGYVAEALLTGWDRQRAWTLAQFYVAAQPFTEPGPERSRTEALRHSLGLSAQGAANVALVAARLCALFPTSFAQLRAGQVTQGHVWALVETTRDLSDEAAGAVEQATYADAPHQTIAEYRKALDRARLVADPEAAERRAKSKVIGRRVTRWTARDGVGKMLAELPAEDLAAAWDALNARAADIRQDDDPRAHGARLADALVEALTGHPAAHDPRRRPDTPTTDYSGDPDDDGFTLHPQAGPDPDPDDPAPGGGVGPLPVPTPPAGGGGAVEVHVVVPVSRMLPRSADLGEGVLPVASRAERRASRRAGRAAGRRGGRWTGRATGRGRVLTSRSIAVVGLDTLMGRARLPGELTSAGWVPAEVIDRLVQGQVLLRRLVVDDSGRLLDAEHTIALPAGELPSEATEQALLAAPYRTHPLDYGATVYRMPAVLRRFIALRDRTCTVPGCGQPAPRCDADHAVPYPHGPTSQANCGALCRWHHRLKTLTGWTLDRLDDGSVLWTSPDGHTRRAPAFSYTRYLS